MIKYSIPGFYELKELNLNFLSLMHRYPEYFYDNVEVEAVYGNPQYCIWDGGRVFNSYIQSSKEEIEELIHSYNHKFSLPIRYIFTNSLLKEEHYHNRFGNLLMELGNNFPNEVVCADDNFMKYLKEKYENYNFISSTTKCILEKEKVHEELNKEDYMRICLDYNLNHNIDFLKTFTPEEKEKTEFLVNAICEPGCTFRKKHYYLNAMSSLNYGKRYRMEYCPIKANALTPEIKQKHITYDDIVNIYEPLGFTHFKIEGRTLSPLDVLLAYCNYMVKPEYKDYIRNELLGGLFENKKNLG